MNVEEMYQQIILDHYREKHHSGLRENYDAEVTQVNPSCGDELLLRVHVDGDVITDVSYDAVGCSISQASTSVMTDLVIGKTIGEAQDLYRGFQDMMRSRGTVELDGHHAGVCKDDLRISELRIAAVVRYERDAGDAGAFECARARRE